MDALNIIGEKYSALGKKLHVKILCTKSTQLIEKASKLVKHFSYSIIEAEEEEDMELGHSKHLGLNITGQGWLGEWKDGAA